MPSALGLSTFAAQNSNILNDGSADSPRGFGNVTTTGTFNITATGPSLYRVVVATPAAPITAALPTTVKAGYRCRIEVELTGSTETNCFFTSPAIAEAQINGTGFVELMALVDNPSVAGDWKVTDVEEVTPYSAVTPTGAYTTACSWAFSRRKNDAKVTIFANTLALAIGTNNNITFAGTPSRYIPIKARFTAWPVVQGGSLYQNGHAFIQATSGDVLVRNPGVVNFTGNILPVGNTTVWQSISYALKD
jgi:hypothetical protein